MPTRREVKAPRKPGGGRSTTLTLKRVQDLTNLLRAGNYVRVACSFIGVGEASFNRWRVRGETELDRVGSRPRTDVDAIMDAFEGEDPDYLDAKGNPMKRGEAEYMWTHRPSQFEATEWPFVVLAHQVERAKAAAEVRVLNEIHKAAGQGNWQAGAWWLERTRPDQYGRRERINLEGSREGEPVQVETVVTVEELNDKLSKVLKGKK